MYPFNWPIDFVFVSYDAVEVDIDDGTIEIDIDDDAVEFNIDDGTIEIDIDDDAIEADIDGPHHHIDTYLGSYQCDLNHCGFPIYALLPLFPAAACD